jgi:photosystem II stability/assembly factor-like uncharacterized protein
MFFTRRILKFSVLSSALALGIQSPTDAQAQTLTQELVSTLEYRSIGPTRQSGRFVDIAVPEGRPWTFYAATASGNLWKTSNSGITFEPLFDSETVFSIGDLDISKSNPDVIYLGSGEANNSRSSYWGDGVYKSVDAGETWTNVGLPESQHIGRVVIHPTIPDIVYVAVLGKLYSENKERGLYKTTDGGGSWDKILGPEVNGKHIGVVDVVMDPTNPDVLYAASFDKVRLPFTYDLGGPGSRVYKTTDGGDTWEMLTNGLPMGMLGRIGIDVYARDPNIVYLTIENANKEDMSDQERQQELLDHKSSRGMIGGEVYRSGDAGASWEKASPDSLSVGGGPAYYYGQIIVDPNDANTVHVLSAASWGTSDGGESWDRRPLGFGGDDHALWIDPEDSNHMILGYDHGLGITYDGGENWYHPDFQSLAQFYAVGYDMSYPYRVAGGLQDNGSAMGPSTNPAGGPIYFEQWERVGGGDGMTNVFDTCTNQYLYNESQFGPISRLDLVTGDRRSIRYDGEGLRWNWNAPILISPHDCNVVFHGANKLLRSSFRGETWEEISPDLTKADPETLTTGSGGDGNIQYATITTVDESILKPGVIWVGTDDGNVQVTEDGGEHWALVNDDIPDHPGYWVSRVEASKHFLGTAYVTFTGYRNDDFRPFVYRTTDFGESWTDISSDLPDGPVNVIREHPQNPDLLFVGTEFQVFVSSDGGAHWASMKNNMPTVPVHDLQIHPRENDLIVATHGRGIYIADISPLVEVTRGVLTQDLFFFQPQDEVRWDRSDRTSYASSNYRGESEDQGVKLYYFLKDDTGDVKFTVYQGGMVIVELEGSGDSGINRVLWSMDKRLERTPEEIEAQRARRGRGGFGGFGGRRGGGGLSAEDRLKYEISDAPPGEYRVVMTVDGHEIERRVTIIRDQWGGRR